MTGKYAMEAYETLVEKLHLDIKKLKAEMKKANMLHDKKSQVDMVIINKLITHICESDGKQTALEVGAEIDKKYPDEGIQDYIQWNF